MKEKIHTIQKKKIARTLEVSRDELLDILNKAGLGIPPETYVSVRDPEVIPGFEDPPPGAPITIRWIEECND